MPREWCCTPKFRKRPGWCRSCTIGWALRARSFRKSGLGGPISEFSVKDPEQVARMMELFGHTGTEASLRINPAILQCSGCVSAFVSMAFLCSGTMTDPQKEYNLEFLTGRRNLARDLRPSSPSMNFALTAPCARAQM